ncbi:two-component regulator propeller domain-containing protein [Bacteroides sp.]
MKTSYLCHCLLCLVFLLCVTEGKADSHNLRQFSSQNGLSNSAILSICQDNNGLVWIGSCDGLNIFDGSTPRLYKPTDAKVSFSGNIIGHIMETEQDVLWIQTNYGLDRFDTRLQTIQSFKEFKDINKMAKSRDNDIYLIKDDGYIYYFLQEEEAFHKLDTEKFPFDNVLQIMVDDSNVLWIFTSDGNSKSYQLKKNGKEVTLSIRNDFQHAEKLIWASVENGLLYFVDSTYAFYEYDLNNKKEYYIADLETEIRNRGEVSSVIKKQNDYYIGFKSSGLIRLKYQPDQKIKYITQSTDIQSGIFCLVKDKFQDIIWIGTDGQGVYMYFTNTFSIKNTLLNTPTYQINNPVRALFLDDEQTLWIGTKGNGILRMLKYRPGEETEPVTERLLTNNSALTDNSVYSFTPSRWKRLWIGTENGIDYYSYPERKLKKFPIVADGKTVKYIHSICESNDSTLWLATVGEGIVKVSLDISKGSPQVKDAKRIVLDEGKRASNYFFVAYQENDSILWFGNRGYGAYRMNTMTGQIKPYLFNQAVKSQTVNDIFAILKNETGYWFGTSFGLTRMYNDNYHVYNETDGFPNNTIHGILEDGKQHLWISTNQGLVRFNTLTNTIQAYHQQNDLKVTEFSDGAYFKDERTGTLFFGGTNGFISINENDFIATEYMPVIQFNRLSIFGKEYNIHEFLHENSQKQKVLELDYRQNFFGLSFIAIDYLNGNNYTYYYKIEGLSDHWIENGTSTTATFSNLSPGQYTLLVKYRSNITGKESTAQSLIIHIIPPWYMTTPAYWCYVILLIGFIAWCIYLSIKRYHRKRDAMIERINRQQRTELYESKLRFFTNVTHEFCTPLTLIYGPCQKVLSYPGTDSYVRKYVSMIQQNAQKLNALILELIEFRRLETGHKTLEIRELPVSEQTQSIAESFCELAESRKINYRLKIEEGLYWNSDSGCFNKIINNLLSNAFKYTPEEGTITVEQYVEEAHLHICISNTGKGIEKENLTKIFDRYKILDHFEIQNKNGISPRNGLGLAICHSMVNLLKGEIQVTSVPDRLTTFEVTLPVLAATVSDTQEQVSMEPMIQDEIKPIELENPSTAYDPSKQTIIIIDDDPSMLWFVSDIFANKYNVFSFSDTEKAMEQLTLKPADLIISDIMMPGTDGISFAKQLKANKLLGHTPLILLSALNSIDDQMKGIDSGAEAYVTKPFNAEYLMKLAERLIQRENDLKEYYNSVFSTFQLDDGQFVHKEDKEFFEKMMRVIDNNITNGDLSVELLSSTLGYSTRHFYRRLKEITEQTPADIIKEYRLAVAEQLLLSTHLSIEEIMDKSGFMNRGTFYKIFSQKHNMTPRQYREQKKKDFKEIADKNRP